MSKFCLAPCAVGVFVPCGFFVRWSFENGVDFSLFGTELLSTGVGAFFAKPDSVVLSPPSAQNPCWTAPGVRCRLKTRLR